MGVITITASVLFFILLQLLQKEVQAAKVICSVPGRWCEGLSLPCPLACRDRCTVDCTRCRTSCAVQRCNRRGAVCQDPRFVGGDGIMFYFHGKKDKDFCIVSDTSLHVNAHFIGKKKVGPGLKRDLTWVQSLGIIFDNHKLYVGAKKVSTWNNAIDQLVLKLDGVPIHIPTEKGAKWKDFISGLKIERIEGTNDISLQVVDSFSLKAKVLPVTKEDSKIHNYGITDEDCFAHLDVSFQFEKLSSNVHGVLGQTYAPRYRNLVNVSSSMPIMGGNHKYATSSLMQPDCAVTRFGALPELRDAKFSFPSVECGSGSGGFICRR